MIRINKLTIRFDNRSLTHAQGREVARQSIALLQQTIRSQTFSGDALPAGLPAAIAAGLRDALKNKVVKQ
jgi:hypothetical protein